MNKMLVTGAVAFAFVSTVAMADNMQGNLPTDPNASGTTSAMTPHANINNNANNNTVPPGSVSQDPGLGASTTMDPNDPMQSGATQDSYQKGNGAGDNPNGAAPLNTPDSSASTGPGTANPSNTMGNAPTDNTTPPAGNY